MKSVKKLTFSAMFLAIAYVLPYLTANNQQLGTMLCPMHIPVMLCGFVCGWQWGLVVGAAAPILRSLIAGMPTLFPSAIGMAFELATYGLVSGLLYKLLPKKLPYIYLDLIVAMVSGRLVWGAARLIMAGVTSGSFGFAAFLSGAVTSVIPAIVIQLALVPPVIYALTRAGLVLNTDSREIKKEPASA